MTTSESAKTDIWMTISAQLEKSRARVAVAHGLTASAEPDATECCQRMREQLEMALADLEVAQRLVEVLHRHRQ